MAKSLPQLAKSQRDELSAVDETNLDAIARAYTAMYGRMQGDIDALILAIEDLENPSSADIKKLPQYKRLIANAEKELDKFSIYLETVMGTAAIAAIGLGLQHSEALVNAAGVSFTGLESGAITPLLGYLETGSPLYNRLAQLTGATVDRVITSIIDGVTSGFNPQKIADLIQDAFGGGLTDALRNTRTVQLWAYRDSARANYMSTNGIVSQWIWWAELDDVCCMSCVAQHGTLHDLDESLDDHYNGRCAALPYIEEFGNPAEQTGQEWFDSLSPEQQKDMMGASKHEAYSSGKFEFSQLSQQQENEVYGTMRTEASLSSLLGE